MSVVRARFRHPAFTPPQATAAAAAAGEEKARARLRAAAARVVVADELASQAKAYAEGSKAEKQVRQEEQLAAARSWQQDRKDRVGSGLTKGVGVGSRWKQSRAGLECNVVSLQRLQ